VFERIVVGLDGSDISEIALRTGAELAQGLGLPLRLVRVADLAVVPWGPAEAAAAYAELSD
jgi:nucleotide-binding universal stress UspA family protein